jgi:hypothetical protein
MHKFRFASPGWSGVRTTPPLAMWPPKLIDVDFKSNENNENLDQRLPQTLTLVPHMPRNRI